jgi:thioredoxin reductase
MLRDKLRSSFRVSRPKSTCLSVGRIQDQHVDVPDLNIEASPTIILKTCTTIVALEGGDRLEGVRWVDHLTGEPEDHEVRRLFMMAGADPNTSWSAAACPWTPRDS